MIFTKKQLDIIWKQPQRLMQLKHIFIWCNIFNLYGKLRCRIIQ